MSNEVKKNIFTMNKNKNSTEKYKAVIISNPQLLMFWWQGRCELENDSYPSTSVSWRFLFQMTFISTKTKLKIA